MSRPTGYTIVGYGSSKHVEIRPPARLWAAFDEILDALEADFGTAAFPDVLAEITECCLEVEESEDGKVLRVRRRVEICPTVRLAREILSALS